MPGQLSAHFLGAGYNGYGQVGDDTYTNRPSPTQVYGAQSWSAVPSNGITNTGGSHFCAVKLDQTMWCWVRTLSTYVSVYSPS